MSLWDTTMSRGDIKDLSNLSNILPGPQVKIPKIAQGTHYDYEKLVFTSGPFQAFFKYKDRGKKHCCMMLPCFCLGPHSYAQSIPNQAKTCFGGQQ